MAVLSVTGKILVLILFHLFTIGLKGKKYAILKKREFSVFIGLFLEK